MNNQVMELITLVVGIFVGTLSIYAIIKIIFDELFKYNSKREAKYEKNLNKLFETCSDGLKMVIDGMSSVLKNELKKTQKENDYDDDFDELK